LKIVERARRACRCILKAVSGGIASIEAIRSAALMRFIEVRGVAAASRAWRLVVVVVTALWKPIRQPVLDGVHWLRHRAPAFVGRWVWWTLRHIPVWMWWVLSAVLYGGWWLLSRAALWCSARDSYAALVVQMGDEQRHGTVKRLREEWTRVVVRRVLVVAGATLGGITVWRGIAERYGEVAPAIGVGLVVLGIGVVARPKDVADAETDSAVIAGGQRPDDPFPIGDAHTRAEASDAVARALRAEGVDLRMVGEAVRQRWGWEVPVILRRGTPAQITDRLVALETSLDLPAGGAMATPDRTRRARVVLRLAERDPFAGMPVAQGRPPASVSIMDRLTVAGLITGASVDLALAGVHGVVIGTSGAGKSSALRVIADAVTATRDAVVVDLDPAGVGLDPLAPALFRIERSRIGIEEALADLLAMAEVRPRIMRDLGMTGQEWNVSHEFPAVVAFVDEYSRLSSRAKELAVELLRIGRKARVSLILAASEATSDTLGDSIADTTALKVLLPCRHADVRLVMGPAMLAEGWRPDRLNPSSSGSAEDAGSGYVHAAHYREPALMKFRPLSDVEAHNRALARAAHRPRIDSATLDGARAQRAVLAIPAARSHSPVPVDRIAVADVLAAFGTDDRLWTVELLTRLADRSDHYAAWGPDDLADLLRPLGVAPTQIRRDGRNRNGYVRDAISGALSAHGGGR
jgi:S-DNA-T family DNA segregation ATPase FtsK/SpoIIIE